MRHSVWGGCGGSAYVIGAGEGQSVLDLARRRHQKRDRYAAIKNTAGWGHNQPDNMEATLAKMMTANNIITTWSSSLALCENEW